MGKTFKGRPLGMYDPAVVSSLSGRPCIPRQYSWPICEVCGQKMTFFIQVELSEEYGLPLASGSVLSIFACVADMELPCRFGSGLLPDGYAAESESRGGFSAFISGPRDYIRHGQCPTLKPETLRFSERVEATKEIVLDDGRRYLSGEDGLKVGGEPFWLQEQFQYTCTCGCAMVFALQICEGYYFDANGPVADYESRYNDEAYSLFFGNAIFVFVCPQLCTPKSLVLLTQR